MLPETPLKFFPETRPERSKTLPKIYLFIYFVTLQQCRLLQLTGQGHAKQCKTKRTLEGQPHQCGAAQVIRAR